MADERPNPLGNAASHAGTAWAGVAGLVGALVTFGTLTSAQGDAINAAGQALSPTIIALGTVLAGVIPLIGGIVASFRTAAAARDHVTPVSDPMIAVGGTLIPLTPSVAQEPTATSGPVNSPVDMPDYYQGSPQ